MRSFSSHRGTTTAAPRGRRVGALPPIAAALAIVPLLAACGPMPESNTASPTPSLITTPVGGLPGTPAAAGSPGALTLGVLGDRIDAAWAGIKSVRVTSTSTLLVPAVAASPVAASPSSGATPAAPAASPVATPGTPAPLATPLARPGTVTVVREAILPDRQRQTVQGRGPLDGEAIAVGGRLVVRGPIAAVLQSGAATDAWVDVDPATLRPDDAAGAQLLGLTLPVTSPAASFPPNLREQVIRPLGPLDVGGRACQAYAVANTTPTGDRLDVTLAVDDQNRPCLIETKLGTELLGRVAFDAYDRVPPIELPAAATPAASPAASPVGSPLASPVPPSGATPTGID